MVSLAFQCLTIRFLGPFFNQRQSPLTTIVRRHVTLREDHRCSSPLMVRKWYDRGPNPGGAGFQPTIVRSQRRSSKQMLMLQAWCYQPSGVGFWVYRQVVVLLA